MRRLTFPVLALAWGCGVHIERPHASPDADSDVDTDADADTGSDTGTEIETPTLVVREVVPDHGPPAGGNEIEIRGDGFGDTLSIAGLTVTIGGRLVETLDLEVVSPRSLRVLRVPPGDVGPADVGVHTAFDGDPIQDATLPNGYFYDVFSLDPPRGTIRGGTKVALTGYGTRWNETAIVTFDGAAATGCVGIGPERIDCRTPPGEPGDSDVRVTGGSGDAAFDDFVEDGFTYYESADPIGGGLGGGPIDGQIVVTVLDYYSRRPIEGAFVMLGSDGATPHQGTTNFIGQIVFSDDGLHGRQDVTAGHEDYASGTFVSFDARDVTILLVPHPTPGGGTFPPIRGPSQVWGELIFEGPNEFGPNPWVIVPDPIDPDERKECHVASTQQDLFKRNPSPGDQSRVTEDEVNPEGRGYPYEIVARSGALAVYALCGLANQRTGDFLPYAMGVRRDVIVGPEALVENVDVVIDIPLDHLTIARLEDAPPEGAVGPDRWRTDVYLDLGGEGLVAREDKSLTSIDPDGDFRFGAQPPLEGTIADARWLFVGGAYTGASQGIPESVVVSRAIHDTIEPIVIGGFLGVPEIVDPDYGGTVVDGRLAWEADGATPTFTAVSMDDVWMIVVRGGVTEVTLPDLAAIAGIPAPPRGLQEAVVQSALVPAIEFDDFSYVYLNGRYWDAWSDDVFQIALR